MKLTNIEINNTNYNNISDLFTALVRMTVDNAFVIDGIQATYSDENPSQNNVTYPDGFHCKDELGQAQIKEQIMTTMARHAKQHDKKIIHDAVKKFLKRSNNKK